MAWIMGLRRAQCHCRVELRLLPSFRANSQPGSAGPAGRKAFPSSYYVRTWGKNMRPARYNKIKYPDENLNLARDPGMAR